MRSWQDKTVLVGVSGGIAAYKSCELVSRLVQSGARVRVVMTAHATQFVGPVTFQALSGNPVHVETFAAPEAYGMGHLALAQDAAALVVAPATANVLGKAAAGLADDLLTTTLLSVACPILFAPAMNPAMWANPIVQRNLALLADHGRAFVGPTAGWLACRDEGEGRMAEPAAILDALDDLLWPVKDLVGRTVLVTAGPTREALDPVRFVSNPSSGKQGYALAIAARRRGARVVLVSGPTALAPPAGVELVCVVSADEMAAAVLARCAQADLVVGVAAVGDWAPVAPAARKQPKGEGELVLRLRATTDIIAAVAARRRAGQVLVGFAAESHDCLAHAADKLARKGLDLIVVNDVTAADAGFALDTNRVTILGADGTAVGVGPCAKEEVAHAVLDAAVVRLGASD